MKTSILSFFFAWALVAQPVEKGGIELGGTVTDSAGVPLRGANVRLSTDRARMLAEGPAAGAARTAQSDERGRFAFYDVPPGTYQLRAELSGFVSQNYGGRPGDDVGAPLRVEENAKPSPLRLVMQPNGSITGRVMDNVEGEERPVAGIWVSAVRWSYEDGHRRLLAHGAGTTTNSAGEFAIAGLPAGRFYLYAAVDRIRPIDPRRTPLETYVPTYFPNAAETAGAAPLEVFPGVQIRADVRLRREILVAIRGKVVGASGKAPAAASVMLLRDEEGPYILRPPSSTGFQFRLPRPPAPMTADTLVDAEGRFTIPYATTGRHRLAAFGGKRIDLMIGNNNGMLSAGRGQEDTPDDGSSAMVEIMVGDTEVEDVEIRLIPAGTISLELSIENSTFLEVLRARLGRDAEIPQAFLERLPQVNLSSDLPISLGGAFSGKVSEPQVQNMTAGRYYVTVFDPPLRHYIKSIRLDGADFSVFPLDFGGGSSSLQVILASDGGEVRGRVANSKGEPVAGAKVSVWPVTPNGARRDGGAIQGTTRQDGSFLVSNVPPGAYHVAAFDGLPDPGLAQYMGFLTQFGGQAVKVTLQPKGAVEASLEIVTKESVALAVGKLP